MHATCAQLIHIPADIDSMFSRTKQDDWKQQYRELLRELETKEGEWDKLEVALRRTASQLATAAMGQSPELDIQVEKVVDLMRPGTDTAELGHSLQVLAATLKQLEAEITSVTEALPGRADTLDARMASLLRGLIEKLTAMPALAGDRMELELELKSCEASGNWSELLNRAADRVAVAIETLRTQRTELERFLEQVQQQLGQFEQFAQWQLDDALSRGQSSAALESTVELEMRGLREEAAKSPNLKTLKLNVQTRLDTVGERLHEYREVEASRLADAEQRNTTLNVELESMRGRMQEMQQVVGQQEAHLMLDALTQVHSRYAYDQRINEECQRAARHGQDFAYALWDIDGFKGINDTFGHAAGDRLLQAVSKMFWDGKRSEDFFARIGGEEFVLLLPMTDGTAALTIANRLREKLAAQKFQHSGQPTRVTISCGVTDFRDGDTSATIYERADRALYQAKEQGRNRCVAA